MIQTVPRISQQPAMASDSAVHYGYVAFNDINLSGPTGIEHRVQPDNSPYYTKLPSRQLIPFTNLTVTEIDPAAAGARNKGRHQPPVIRKPKSAKECVTEMANCYDDWGFKELTPINGLSEEQAFHIFQVIQPFPYRLKDLDNELSFGALDRIAETETFTVEYDGEKVSLEPLPSELKPIAEKTRSIMASSASVAYDRAMNIFEKTTLSMTKAFAGGDGKAGADPLDRYIAAELGRDLPKLVSAGTMQQNHPVQQFSSVSPEMLDIERRKLELMERQIAIEEAKMGLSRAAEAPADASTTAVESVSTGKAASKPSAQNKAAK